MTTPADTRERVRGSLTAAQRQLWHLDRQTTDPSVLNLSYALSIEGELDAGSLDGAFRDVVRQRTALRTTYALDGGRAIASVADEDLATPALALAPLRVSEEEATELARADRLRGFDLERETPFRASLLELEPERHVLLLTFHHIAADGWSLRLLGQQLSRAYAARRRGRRMDERPERGECLDDARRQRDRLAGPRAEQEALWWIDHLRDASPALANLAPSAEGTAVEMRRHVIRVPDALTAELRTLARTASVSVFALLMAGFEALVGRWSNCETPLLGTLAANRTTPASASMLGAHYNALLVPADLRGDPTLADCVERVSSSFLSTLDHQALPYADLRERLESELGWSTAVPAAMLLIDRYPMEELQLAGCKLTGLHLDEGEAATPLDGGGPPATFRAATVAALNLFVREVGDRLTVSSLASPGVDEATAIALLHAYLEVLQALCAIPYQLVGALDVEIGEPPRHGRQRGPEEPGLREILTIAPAEALSPVGRWAACDVDDR